MNNPSITGNTACVILSGGHSRRMNTHKALLRYSDQETFIQHIVRIYLSARVQQIVFVKNAGILLSDTSVFGNTIKVIENTRPEWGRMYSVWLALQAVNTDYAFIQNIDNPTITEELIRGLYHCRSRADYITPVYNDRGGHPVLISRPVINSICCLSEYDTTLHDHLRQFSRYKFPAFDSNCMLNINNPSDYEEFIIMKNQFQTLS